MAKQSLLAAMQCSLARSLDIIGDGWSPLILRDVHAGIRRFDQLIANLGLSRNLLTERLKHLQDGGILSRRIYSERPLRFEYELTPAGLELIPVLMALTAWGDKWVRPPEGKPMLFRHVPCGHLFAPEIVCPYCRAEIAPGEVSLQPGPGGQRKRGTMLIAEMLAPDRKA